MNISVGPQSWARTKTAAGNAELARKLSRKIKPSKPLKPLVACDVYFDGKMNVQSWSNGLWNVTSRRYKDGWPLGGGEYVLLCIHCEDGEPRHDWRIFQQIKNQLCGPEWEAIELYPAESRLLDPSNLFMLWCAPSIPIGKFEGRRINSSENCIAPQRDWEKDAMPVELKTERQP